MCTQALCAWARSQASSNGSKAPRFRSPAASETIVGASGFFSSSAFSAATSIVPSSFIATWTTASVPMPRWRSARSRVSWCSPTSTRIGGLPARPLLLDRPALVGQHPVTGGGQRRDVRHLAAGDEGIRRLLRQAEQVLQPVGDDLLDDRGRRRAGVGAGVLIPGRGQPVGGDRDRDPTADDPAEEAAAGAVQQAVPGVSASSSITCRGGRPSSVRSFCSRDRSSCGSDSRLTSACRGTRCSPRQAPPHA